MQTHTKIRAIFSDLDGTLLTDDKRITPDTRQAITQITAQQIPFVLSSARPPASIEPIVKTYDLDCCMIAFSGGLILDEQRNVLYEEGFPLSDAIRLKDYIEHTFPDVTWNIYMKDTWIVRDLSDPRILHEAEVSKATPTAIPPEQLAPDSTVFKVMCICDPDRLAEIQLHLQKAFPQYAMVKSFYNLIEIIRADVNKAEAIRHFCSTRNIPLEKTIAFGDNYNDLEMLHAVGLGIVMKNAPEEIRSQFQYVTEDNEHDGIARALENLGLTCI